MEKIIVTHFNIDLDALTGVWLVKRFFPGWEEAEVKLVSAGETLNGQPPDEDPSIIHLDTGLGKFDHHQKRKFECAASLCLDEVLMKNNLENIDEEALKRLVSVVTEIDNGQDISWPEANADRYEFMLHNFFESSFTSEDLVGFGMTVLDRIFQEMKKKINAERVLSYEGVVFKTRWGKAVAVETSNDQVLRVGQKQGFVLVAKKNPNTGFLRIYGRWDKKIDLTEACEEFKKVDPLATWYLHPSKCLLLNGSLSRPNMVPTKLKLKEIVEILRKTPRRGWNSYVTPG